MYIFEGSKHPAQTELECTRKLRQTKKERKRLLLNKTLTLPKTFDDTLGQNLTRQNFVWYAHFVQTIKQHTNT